MSKPKVALICVHNSWRSQIAEALGKHFASETFDIFHAGTETKPQINQDAVRNMKQIYGIDMENTQHSKQLSDSSCWCSNHDREDWGLEDPTGKSDETFKQIKN